MGIKRRTVINADSSQVDRALAMVAAGRYRNLSDFVREAIDEKLARIERARLDDEVARYCAAGHANEDLDLIEAQAMDERQAARRAAKKKTSRAKG